LDAERTFFILLAGMQRNNAFDIVVGAEALWEEQRAAISAENEVAPGCRNRLSRTGVASCAFIAAMRSDVEVGQGAVDREVHHCARSLRRRRRLPCAPKRPTIDIRGNRNAVVFQKIGVD